MKRPKTHFSPSKGGQTKLSHLPHRQSELVEMRSTDHLLASARFSPQNTSFLGGLGRVVGFFALLGILVAGTVATGLLVTGVGH